MSDDAPQRDGPSRARLRQLFLDLLPSSADSFSRSRFEEGERTFDLLDRLFPGLLSGRPRILDLGSGNGGMLFPFAATGSAVALDTYVDPDLRRFAAASGLSVGHVEATASALPFSSGALDVILHEPRAAAAEVMRVLRPGGVCVLSTPPRLKFLTKPDPHFGIRGLLLLPDFLQRRVQAALRPDHSVYVDHIYSTVGGLYRLFPRGSCSLRVISHRRDWTRNLSWNYLALQKLPSDPNPTGRERSHRDTPADL
jgi:SAM-dependent methyltransferase